MKLQKFLTKEYIALLLYAVLVVFLIYHHEPWRDEADTWLMVRECTLSQVFQRMPYAGTPGLWYLILWPFAQMGFPYITINIVSALFGIASIALLMLFSPFGFLTNSLIAFSYLFSYEYPVVARSYQVSIFLIFLIAACHRIRFHRPILYSTSIALLANTNVHSLLVALCLSFVYTISLIKRKASVSAITKGLLPAGIGVMLAIFQLIPPADGQGIRKECQYNLSFISLPVREAFTPQIASIDHGGLREPFDLSLSGQALGFLTAMAIVGSLIAIRKSAWATSTLFLSWLGLISLFVMVYGGSLRHWGFFVIMTIYALWVALQEAKISKADNSISRVRVYDFLLTRGAFTATLVLSVATAVTAWVKDAQGHFSGGKDAAQFIAENGLDQFPIASYPMSLAKPILPYMPTGSQMYYPNEGRFGSYGKWNADTYNLISERKLMRRLDRRFGKDRRLVLVVAGSPLKEHARGFRLAYNTPVTLTTDERYFIYVRERQGEAQSDRPQSASTFAQGF